MKKWIAILAILLCPIILAGCCTIISGRTQKMGVTTTPAEAIVICNGVEQKSPCTLILDRTNPAYQITIKKDGYRTVNVELKRGINGWIFGNIVFGGVIGIVIDVADGSCYSFSPDSINQNLVEGSDAIVIKTVDNKK